MNNQFEKVRDDEKLFWFVGGGLFAAVLIAVDIWYSSYSIMNSWLLVLIVLLHIIIAGLWIGILEKFTNPNYDHLRKWCVYITGATIIAVCLHNALNNENKQVLIDAENNRIKDSIEQAQYDSTLKLNDIKKTQ